MESIFEKPLILDGNKGNVVLIYSDYIIGDISKEAADSSVERMNDNLFNPSDFESIINVKSVFEYELELDIDLHIMFSVRDESGTSFKNIDFKDAETAKKAEKLIQDYFKKLGLTRKEEQMTAMGAAVSPLIITGIIAIVGGLLSWMTYELEDYESPRTRVVKWYVYLMVKISKSVGYLPFLIIAALAVLWCLFWTAKRMIHPPLLVKAVKN